MNVPPDVQRVDANGRSEVIAQDSAREWWPFVAVYEELRKAARGVRWKSWDEDSLGPTELVHEAVLRLVKDRKVTDHPDPNYVFAAGLRAMRRILCERTRSRKRLKHGGGVRRLPIDDVLDHLDTKGVDVQGLHEALDRLGERDPRQAQTVTLRYFLKLSNREVADCLKVSLSTVENDLRSALAWLRREMAGMDEVEKSARSRPRAVTPESEPQPTLAGRA